MLDEERSLLRTGFLLDSVLIFKGQELGLGDILRFCAKMGVSMRQWWERVLDFRILTHLPPCPCVSIALLTRGL